MGFNWMWGTDDIRDSVMGKPAEIMTQEIKDPKKEAVASPLSKYLAGEVGQGVPMYGKQILSDIPQAGMDRANAFMGMDAGEYFTKNIQDPAIQTFKEDMLPLVREEFAGSLSGSGRFRTEEEAASKFTRGLATARAEFETSIPQAQFQMAKEIKVEADKEAQAQYQDWYKSLPQFNPALGQSLSFLSEQTNSGKTTLSYLDEGSEGMMGDILKLLATLAAVA